MCPETHSKPLGEIMTERFVITQTKYDAEMMRYKAFGYAWGRIDADPSVGVDSTAFATLYRNASEDYAMGRRNMLPSLPTAWQIFVETGDIYPAP